MKKYHMKSTKKDGEGLIEFKKNHFKLLELDHEELT